jgi:putative DNA primase/helicase
MPPPVNTPTDSNLISPEFVSECLANNERGDGILYASINKGAYVYVKKSAEWLVWRGHHWDIDVYDEHLRSVEKVAIAYLTEGDKLGEPIKRQKERLDTCTTLLKEANDLVKQYNREAKKAAKGGNDAALEATHPEGLRAEAKAAELEEQARGILHELNLLKDQQKQYFRRVTQLRGTTRAGNCVKWAHVVENAVAISGDELDQNPYLLPCPNGVVDLRTGEIQPGNPFDWMVRATKVDYYGYGHSDPIIEQFMESILPDPAEREFLQILLGYSISGLVLEQFIAVILGEGRNGKGLLFEMLEEVLGPFYWTYKSELLLESKNPPNPQAASPHIMALRGRRICAASETDKGKVISPAKVKELTGADTQNARQLNDKKGETNFRPTHKLFLRTNHVPRGLAEDFALKERLIHFKFPFMYVDDPVEQARKKPEHAKWFKLKDRDMKAKLMNAREAMLSWLVRGFAKWQTDKRLKPPESMKQAVNDLQMSEDKVAQFLESCIDSSDRDFEERFKHLYDLFLWWYQENFDDRDNKKPSKRWFSEQLIEKGFRKIPSGGQTYFYGLRRIVQVPDKEHGHSGWSA